MQPEPFSLMARNTGLDVLALRREFRCSYASVTLRLAEVVRDPPLMTVLYERLEGGRMLDRAARPPGDGGSQDVGFGTRPSRLLSGTEGGLPRWGRPLPAGSLADRAVHWVCTQYQRRDGYAVIARPVLWKRKLAKVVVVAVPRPE